MGAEGLALLEGVEGLALLEEAGGLGVASRGEATGVLVPFVLVPLALVPLVVVGAGGASDFIPKKALTEVVNEGRRSSG